MQINYIILVHQNPNQLSRLVQRLKTENVRFYIHIDLKSDLSRFRSQLERYSRHVIFIENRVNCIWGDISMVYATLNCMIRILADQRTGYTVLMSSQDYPLKSNEYILSFFNQHYGVNLINLFSLPTSNWRDERGGMNRVEFFKLNLSDRRSDFRIVPPLINSRILKYFANAESPRVLAVIDENLEILMKPRATLNYIDQFYGGSQWWALPIESIEYILNFLDLHPDYVDIYKFSFVPDELFFHTIVGNTPELFEKVQKSVTYVDWESNGPFRPAIFDISYFDKLIIRDELFARKFDLNLDSQILDQIDCILELKH